MEHQVEIPNPNHAAFFKNPEMNAIITDVWKPVLLSHRHPLLYRSAVFYHRIRRRIAWLRSGERLATGYWKEGKFGFNVKRHSSRLIRKLGDTELRLQYNKVENIRLCLPHLDGLIIEPGEVFSFCRLVGKPTKRRGFKSGMELSMGRAQEGIGGGICQIANLLHWLVLHSPLTVTERSTHSFDPFPDSNRSIPFGTGCALFYNYVDFCFRNDTDHRFQLHLGMDETSLIGSLSSERMIEHGYKIFERNHHFVEQDGVFFRHNEIWRKVSTRIGAVHIRDEHIKTNHVRVMYTPESCIC